MHKLCSTRPRCEGKVTQLLQGVFYPVVGAFTGAVTTSTIYIIETQPFNPNNIISWNANRRVSSVLGVKQNKHEVHTTHSGWFIYLLWTMALDPSESAALRKGINKSCGSTLQKDVLIILWCPCNRQVWLCNYGKLLRHSAFQKSTADV